MLLAAIAVVVVLAIGTVTWLAIADDGGDGSSTASPTVTVPGRLAPATRDGAPGVGDPAPDFALPSLVGTGTVRLSDFRGTPVVLNFWASWCTPCRDEFPLLRAADLGAAGRYQIVGVDSRDQIRADARAFVKDEQAEWPNGYDGRDSVLRAYGVNGQPQTLFIDAEGTIVSRVAGPLTEQSLAANLRTLTR